MVTSNTIQPSKLSYKHNIVTESIAYIFVNSGITVSADDEPCVWTDFAERGEMARELYQDILQFETKVITNCSKVQIMGYLQELRQRAEIFE